MGICSGIVGFYVFLHIFTLGSFVPLSSTVFKDLPPNFLANQIHILYGSSMGKQNTMLHVITQKAHRTYKHVLEGADVGIGKTEVSSRFLGQMTKMSRPGLRWVALGLVPPRQPGSKLYIQNHKALVLSVKPK